MSDKSGWEGRSQQFRDSRWGRQGSVPSTWTQPKEESALEPLEGCIMRGCWELKRKFRLGAKCGAVGAHGVLKIQQLRNRSGGVWRTARRMTNRLQAGSRPAGTLSGSEDQNG